MMEPSDHDRGKAAVHAAPAELEGIAVIEMKADGKIRFQ
jgi:hypothetical protein